MKGARSMERSWLLPCIMSSLRFAPSRMVWRLVRRKFYLSFMVVLCTFMFLGSYMFTRQLLVYQDSLVSPVIGPLLFHERDILSINTTAQHLVTQVLFNKDNNTHNNNMNNSVDDDNQIYLVNRLIGHKLPTIESANNSKNNNYTKNSSDSMGSKRNTNSDIYNNNRKNNKVGNDDISQTGRKNTKRSKINFAHLSGYVVNRKDNNTHALINIRNVKDKDASISLIRDNKNIKHNKSDGSDDVFLDEVLYRPSEGKPAKIIITGRFRTGSSFVGSFFQYHPQVHYTFEPLQFYPTPFTEERQDYMEHISEMRLRELLNCQYLPLLRDAARYNAVGMIRIHRWWAISVCRPKVTMKMLCPRKVRTLESICKGYLHKAIKEITISNFTSLVPLMKSGVKVIHLVRDPRGQVNSIMKLYGGNNTTVRKNLVHFRWKLTEICDDLRETFRSIYDAFITDRSLVANYKLLRYEEIAMAPMEKGKELYKFVNIKPNDLAMNVLLKTTTMNKGGSLSVSRNSSSIPFAWINRLPTLLKEVAHHRCCDVLHMLGYPLLNPFAKYNIDTMKLEPVRVKLLEAYEPTCPFKLEHPPKPFLVLS